MEQDQREIAQMAQQAILRERQAQHYQVKVSLPEPKDTLLGYPMPAGIITYQAITTCTIKHESGIPCLWIDFAFIRPDGAICVILESNIEASGIPYDDCIKELVKHFERIAQNPVRPRCEYVDTTRACTATATMCFPLAGEDENSKRDLYLCDRHSGLMLGELFGDLPLSDHLEQSGGQV